MSPAAADYEAVAADIERLAGAEEDSDAIVRGAVEAIHDRLDTYSWVGIYFVEGEELVLGPWKGPSATDHVRIPIGQGVCGAAAASGVTEIVDDVNADPRYLACFLNTRAEIVVPIQDERMVYGEIDIDGDRVAAFGPVDRAFLEGVAARLAERVGARPPR